MVNATNRPFRADTLLRMPATCGRCRSCSSPNSSTMETSYPDGVTGRAIGCRRPRSRTYWRRSPISRPGHGVRRTCSPSSPDAAGDLLALAQQLASLCRGSPTARRSASPARRSGPHRCASASTAISADFAFFRAIHSSVSRCRRHVVKYRDLPVGEHEQPAGVRMPGRHAQPLVAAHVGDGARIVTERRPFGR